MGENLAENTDETATWAQKYIKQQMNNNDLFLTFLWFFLLKAPKRNPAQLPVPSVHTHNQTLVRV